MKVIKMILIFLVISGLASGVFARELKRTAKIIDVKGQAEVRMSKTKYWRPASIGMILSEGDVLRTNADSWALLGLEGDSRKRSAVVEVKEKSQLLLSELRKDGKKRTSKTLLDLSLGKILIKANRLRGEGQKFEVKTPTSVVGVRGTTFAVEVRALK